MNNDTKQQFTLRIAQANSTELIVILYEMVLCYLADAKEHCINRDEAEFQEALRKTRSCIQELLASVKNEHELADNLNHLYWFAIRRLAQCQFQHDEGLLNQLQSMFAQLHDSYVVVAKMDTSSPIMDRTQEVYVGLTYGKNTLTENRTNAGGNRGFCA
jgi:flagellar protein FliS